MKKYQIKHDRESCIGCGACVAICPKFWLISKEDGKAVLIKGKQRNGYFIREISEKEVSENKDVADSCPINAISIVEEE